MTLFLQQLASGIATGMIFGGLALALSVVFSGTSVLNFAQGEMATLTTFLFWSLLSIGLPFWVAFVCVIPIGFLVGMVVERVFIRPVERSEEITILIVTLALFLGLNALTGLIWGFNPQTIESPFGFGALTFGGVGITYQQIGMTLTMLAAALLVAFIFHYTRLGLQLRAVAMNRRSSQYLGINVSLLLAVGWGIAAATGAVAGALIVPMVGLSPDMMSSSLLLAFAALTLGGSSSRMGALVGGILVGVVTNLGVTYIPGLSGDVSDLVPFGVILIVLLVRPQGLFGKRSAVRS